MSAWSLNAPTAGAAADSGPQERPGIDRMISALGQADFGKSLLGELNEMLYVDFLSVYQLDKKSLPRMFLSSSLHEVDVSADCFKSYQVKLHARDHTFDLAMQLLEPSGLSMVYMHQKQFAPAHRDAIYNRHGIQDRLSIVCDGGRDGLLAANLYRFERHPTFGSRDVGVVEQYASTVIACVRKHIAICHQESKFGGLGHAALAERLGQLYPGLTRRELDVCEGLLIGRTYDGIAAGLGLSVATIKTYRARAFDKMGINFKSQLFAIASGLLDS